MLAFGVGALLVVVLWAWLQAHGVRGPWARAIGPRGSGQEERWAGASSDVTMKRYLFSANLVEGAWGCDVCPAVSEAGVMAKGSRAV